MLHLTDKSLEDKNAWETAGFILPKFDRSDVMERTLNNPTWLHFGAGNIFRAYIAEIAQQLIDDGLTDTGIIVAEGYDGEIVDMAYKPYNNLGISVTLKSDGSYISKVIACVAESTKMDCNGFLRLKEIFEKESLQMISFTITEKGYSMKSTDGQLHSNFASDFATGPGDPVSFMGKITALCYHRYKNGAKPLTLVSMDNVSNNGKCLHEVILTFAKAWVACGHADDGFVDYINDPLKLSFPWTMIDKITPGPGAGVAGELRKKGLDIPDGMLTTKNTDIAPFVNAEETGYLVIEDTFPNGRPPLEKTGVIMTGRETVNKAEKMKVCTCLNPLHTALSIFASLLGINKVSDAMQDDDIVKFIRRIADEGMPVVIDPGILSPKDFADTVINIRLPNPSIPDTVFRIVTDTSQKLSVRFGETIKAYTSSNKLDVNSLDAIPLALAGWCRYLVGIDDAGNTFQLAPDPLLAELRPLFSDFLPGKDANYSAALRSLLSNSAIFGIDLYEAGIAPKIEEYFKEMMSSRGAVRVILHNLS
ncbi:MAG: mannitol dehydrogenase family protein [Oscillospiraceae bacterium]|nr:mannitol dehydrogenase family protein [Oscillospiraceae bacterium]